MEQDVLNINSETSTRMQRETIHKIALGYDDVCPLATAARRSSRSAQKSS
jgi:hypothetical protein